MRESHIVLDQLYSYSPATNALQAMALGRVVGSGAEPEYYRYIGLDSEVGEGSGNNQAIARPIFHLSPLIPDLKERLASLATDIPRMQRMSREGRELVERHNDVKIVADRFLEAWQK